MAYGSVKVDQIITSTQTLTVDDIPSGAAGSVTNTQLAGSIADSKLSTINTAGKVSGAAITSGTIGGSAAVNTSSTIATSGLVKGGTLAVGLSAVSSNVDLDVTGAYAGNKVTMSGNSVDCSTGNYFCHTASGSHSYSFTNVPASGRAYSFTLEVYKTGSGTLTWPSAVKWPADTAPTVSDAKTSLFVFITDDGGARWRGVAAVDYVN